MDGETQAILEVFGLAGDHQSRRGVDQRHVAKGRRLAFENVLHRLGVVGCVTAAQGFRLDLAQAKLGRRNLERLDLAVLQRRNAGRAGRGYLVEPVGAVHHPHALGAEIFQNLRQRLRPLLGENPDHLPAHAGRVGERAEQVEDRARAKLGTGRPDILHRRVMRRREHEADPSLGDAARDPFRRQIDIDAERGKHVGSTRTRGQRAIAVLGDGHAGAGHNDRGAGGNVERARSVAAGADDVDRVGRRGYAQHLGAHRRDRAGDLIDRLAAHAQRHQ